MMFRITAQKIFIVQVSDDKEHWWNDCAFVNNQDALNYTTTMNAHSKKTYAINVVKLKRKGDKVW